MPDLPHYWKEASTTAEVNNGRDDGTKDTVIFLDWSAYHEAVGHAVLICFLAYSKVTLHRS